MNYVSTTHPFRVWTITGIKSNTKSFHWTRCFCDGKNIDSNKEKLSTKNTGNVDRKQFFPSTKKNISNVEEYIQAKADKDSDTAVYRGTKYEYHALDVLKKIYFELEVCIIELVQIKSRWTNLDIFRELANLETKELT